MHYESWPDDTDWQMQLQIYPYKGFLLELYGVKK